MRGGGLAISLLATAFWASSASALPVCPSPGSCVAGGVTFNQTDPGDATHGTTVEIDDSALTFMAVFTPGNQSNATVSAAVLAYLTAEGFTGVSYLGRQDGTGNAPGTSVATSSSDGGLSGSWTFTPGASGLVGSFIAIHGGGGTSSVLFSINNPGLSGIWDTSENIVGPGNQAQLSNFDLFGNVATSTHNVVPEPASLLLLGTGLLGLALLRRRRTRPSKE